MLPRFNAEAALGTAAKKYPGAYVHGALNPRSGQVASPASIVPSQLGDAPDDAAPGEEMEAGEGLDDTGLEDSGGDDGEDAGEMGGPDADEISDQDDLKGDDDGVEDDDGDEVDMEDGDDDDEEGEGEDRSDASAGAGIVGEA